MPCPKTARGRAPPFGAPAAPCDQNGPLDPPRSQRRPGFTEIYGFFRSTLGWNQLSGTKAFAIGPLTNIEFIVGGDFNTDNTTLGSAKRAFMGGCLITSTAILYLGGDVATRTLILDSG